CALHNLTELVVTSGLKPKMAILGNFLTINLSLSSFQRTIICLKRDIMGGYFACAKIPDGWLFCSRKKPG
uniref:hypothetical protein n=1 Tax=Rossellomorea arthrocnemi TaxID=2769542 RepID=UPI001E470EE5